MRIFSNFDTNNRNRCLEEYSNQYGKENVLCFWRSRLYWFIRIFFPLLFVLLLSAWILLLLYYIFDGEYMLFFVLAIFVLSLFFILPILNRWIDYKMDFIIVTPDSFILYDQGWILSKKVVTVNEKSIKTISVDRPGLLYSIFNNGDITVLSEWDEDNGEIVLKWIPKPEKRKDEITKILKKE